MAAPYVEEMVSKLRASINEIARRHGVCWDADENVFVGTSGTAVAKADADLNWLLLRMQAICQNHMQVGAGLVGPHVEKGA